MKREISNKERKMIENGKSHIRIELQTKNCGRRIFIISPDNNEEEQP